MEIIRTIVLTILIALLLFNIYIMIRNSRVYTFRMFVADNIALEVNKRIKQDAITTKEISIMFGILNTVSYAKMLFSFKPLRVEYWFTKEELKIMGYESKS